MRSVAAVASGFKLVDAISVAGLAGFLDAPVLMTPSDSLNGAVADFITDQDIEQVVIMGGASSVSDDVSKALTSAGVDTVTHIDGDSPADASAPTTRPLRPPTRAATRPPRRAGHTHGCRAGNGERAESLAALEVSRRAAVHGVLLAGRRCGRTDLWRAPACVQEGTRRSKYRYDAPGADRGDTRP